MRNQKWLLLLLYRSVDSEVTKTLVFAREDFIPGLDTSAIPRLGSSWANGRSQYYYVPHLLSKSSKGDNDERYQERRGFKYRARDSWPPQKTCRRKKDFLENFLYPFFDIMSPKEKFGQSRIRKSETQLDNR